MLADMLKGVEGPAKPIKSISNNVGRNMVDRLGKKLYSPFIKPY